MSCLLKGIPHSQESTKFSFMHKDLLAAGIIIAGAGDPSASIGNAKAMIIHAEDDETVSSANASALAQAWNATFVFYDNQEHWLQHDCWNYAIENEDLLGWLLTK